MQSNLLKGYSRMGTALAGLHRFDEAIQEYEKGLKLEPNNQQIKEAFEEAQKQKESTSSFIVTFC